MELLKIKKIILAGMMLTVLAGCNSKNSGAASPTDSIPAKSEVTDKKISRDEGPQSGDQKIEASGAAAPVFLDVPVYSGGQPIDMTQYFAFTYCAQRGAHIPTVRELAEFAVSMGAKGIQGDGTCPDSRFNKCRNVIATRYKHGKETQGVEDRFDFSWDGYQAPEGPAGQDQWFWTSSVDGHDTGYAYIFHGRSGAIGEVVRTQQRATVRCVVDTN